jgi:hypothetical protein
MHVTLEGESLRLIGTAVARALAGCTDAELDDREAIGRHVLSELQLRGFVLIETPLDSGTRPAEADATSVTGA